ncbi:hypothetical protein [Lysobacter capsici]|uniref:hypothetical protein n=1 Tax=Lysobacter capsici TaxID=435897 RepID=UPI001C0054D8|nr:hypothetical protein [Lysobacter capsici]QWF19485.1 hypothetical protein KME82_12445 [Lysobacter capsici]
MAAIQDKVRPGDVISSDLLNRIIGLLNEHDTLLAGSGPSGNLITGFDPASEQNVGKNLIVLGDFDFPIGSNNLSIDGIPIAPASFLLGSSASQLVFNIPISIVVPPSGSKSVVVRVVNSKGTGERNFLLKPQIAAPPDPTVSAITDHGTNTTPLRSGQNARIVGRNFASPATSNRVRLIFNVGQTQVAFPANAGESLVIDPVASVILPASQDSTLVVMLPPIGASLIPIVGQSAPGFVEITAPGANNPVTQGVQVRRMS